MADTAPIEAGPHTSPAERRRGGRQHPLRWLVAIGVTPVIIGGIALAALVAGPSEPSVPLQPPPGYKAITDAYFAYAVPQGWSENSAYTDSNGDFFYQGSGGWAAETLRIQNTAPGPQEAPPASIAVFGEPHPTPYRLEAGADTTVPGADLTRSYDVYRGGSVYARLVEAWVRSSRTEIWLEVRAGGTRGDTILSSLRA